MKRDELVALLDHTLDIHGIEDQSPNGLQVEGRSEVHRLGFAVDYSPELAETAAADRVDFLVVHHGLIWGSVRYISGITRAFLRPLILHELSLYVAHLPMDVHPRFGHSMCLARVLGLQAIQPFGECHGKMAGAIGSLPAPLSRTEWWEIVRRVVNRDLQVLDFGTSTIQRVAIVSGGASGLAVSASEAGADCLLTGEPSHSTYYPIRQAAINVGFAGHYHTEHWGLRELKTFLDDQGITDSIFYDRPTPF